MLADPIAESPATAASVPVELLLDHIERDPLVTEEDRAFFRELIARLDGGTPRPHA